MILVAGGTGRLGSEVVRLLTARGLGVRVLTRDPARVENLDSHVEVAVGDTRNPRDLPSAIGGVRTVVSAMHGFAGNRGNSPQTVDWQGNRHLIQAARRGGVEHFVLVSVQGAAPDHPIELFRMKYRAEEELMASGLAWTIIRPTAFMETWITILGEPLLRTGTTRLFGRGQNPINFVSACDVARFVEQAVISSALCGQTIEVGGPENLTLTQFVQTFETAAGRAGTKDHVPLPLMRIMSVILRPIRPSIARQIQAGIVMDTCDMAFDYAKTRRCCPEISPTGLADVVRRNCASTSQRPPPAAPTRGGTGPTPKT